MASDANIAQLEDSPENTQNQGSLAISSSLILNLPASRRDLAVLHNILLNMRLLEAQGHYAGIMPGIFAMPGKFESQKKRKDLFELWWEALINFKIELAQDIHRHIDDIQKRMERVAAKIDRVDARINKEVREARLDPEHTKKHPTHAADVKALKNEKKALTEEKQAYEEHLQEAEELQKDLADASTKEEAYEAKDRFQNLVNTFKSFMNKIRRQNTSSAFDTEADGIDSTSSHTNNNEPPTDSHNDQAANNTSPSSDNTGETSSSLIYDYDDLEDDPDEAASDRKARLKRIFRHLERLSLDALNDDEKRKRLDMMRLIDREFGFSPSGPTADRS